MQLPPPPIALENQLHRSKARSLQEKLVLIIGCSQLSVSGIRDRSRYALIVLVLLIKPFDSPQLRLRLFQRKHFVDDQKIEMFSIDAADFRAGVLEFVY